MGAGKEDEEEVAEEEDGDRYSPHHSHLHLLFHFQLCPEGQTEGGERMPNPEKLLALVVVVVVIKWKNVKKVGCCSTGPLLSSVTSSSTKTTRDL